MQFRRLESTKFQKIDGKMTEKANFDRRKFTVGPFFTSFVAIFRFQIHFLTAIRKKRLTPNAVFEFGVNHLRFCRLLGCLISALPA